MASSSPPVIPISVPSVPAAPAGQQAAPINTPAFRLFLSRFSDSVRRSLANQRPWHELFDRSAFSRPESLSDALARLRKNASYFKINYAAVFAVTLALTLVTNPFSLFVLLALLAAWCFLYLFRPSDSPLVLFGRQFSDWETLVGLSVMSVFVIFLSSVGSLLMSAVTVATAMVCAHGAFRAPEDLFLDEQDGGGATTGFLSFLGGASSAATGAALSVASRV